MGKTRAVQTWPPENRSPDPCKKPGMARGTCNPSAGVEVGDRWSPGTYCLESLNNQEGSGSMRDQVTKH